MSKHFSKKKKNKLEQLQQCRKSHRRSVNLIIDLLNIPADANKGNPSAPAGIRRVHFREDLPDLILINSLIRRALSMPCTPAHTFEPSSTKAAESWRRKQPNPQSLAVFTSFLGGHFTAPALFLPTFSFSVMQTSL